MGFLSRDAGYLPSFERDLPHISAIFSVFSLKLR